MVGTSVEFGESYTCMNIIIFGGNVRMTSIIYAQIKTREECDF